MLLAILLNFGYGRSTPSTRMDSRLSTNNSQPPHYWTNSLGMVFVPVPGAKVQFCILEKSEKHYPRRKNQYPGTGGMADGTRHNPFDAYPWGTEWPPRRTRVTTLRASMWTGLILPRPSVCFPPTRRGFTIWAATCGNGVRTGFPTPVISASGGAPPFGARGPARANICTPVPAPSTRHPHVGPTSAFAPCAVALNETPHLA